MTQIIVTKKKEVDIETVFDVVVKEGSDKTSHIISLKKEYCKELTGGKTTPEELIVRSFEFLLERESKWAILPKFDLKVISQYFPEYEDEIKN